jgi:hypothetical protein
MAYNTRRIKTDFDGKPTPQYFDVELDSYEPQHGLAGAASVHVIGTLVHDAWEGSSTTTRNLTKQCVGVNLKNDGTSDIVLNINDLSITIKAGEHYSAKFQPFTVLTLTTTSPYRAEVMI